MSKARRSYSAEFKIEALRLLETSGKTASEIERELGIGDGCLLQWKRRHEANGSQAFPGHGRLPADQEEVARLQRELEIVRQERDILKKAVAIFSHPSTGDSRSSTNSGKSSR